MALEGAQALGANGIDEAGSSRAAIVGPREDARGKPGPRDEPVIAAERQIIGIIVRVDDAAKRGIAIGLDVEDLEAGVTHDREAVGREREGCVTRWLFERREDVASVV